LNLAQNVNIFGQVMLARCQESVQKVTINAGFTCPDRVGIIGCGGCTLCNYQY
jgi:hypothetical protein